MRWTKKRVLYTVLEGFFLFVAPIIIIWAQYGGASGTAFKISLTLGKVSITLIVLLIIVFYIAKKVFIERRIERMRTQSIQLEADLKVEPDAAKITNIENELKFLRVVEYLLAIIIPTLIVAAAIAATHSLCSWFDKVIADADNTVEGLNNALKSVREHLNDLFAVMLEISGCFIAGGVFGFLEAREVVGKHRGQ